MPLEKVCVYAVADVKIYHDVKTACTHLGGIPIKIESILENAFAFSRIEEFHGIGGYIGVVKHLNGDWTYADGTVLKYQNWAPNEPNNKPLFDCTHMEPTTGKWESTECFIPRPYFCSVHV
ncbi:unnamed protein product, partial [Mesorhabditis belari]|uniref:C-type lectin domain-containing protein n=1 Tax=Mesorhabditis belari TaxID=2138241 RepID=A0AAF3EJD8_9BILA